MTSPVDLSAGELLDQFARKVLSPAEYWEILIGHVEAREPELGALYGFDPDPVRLAARAATERWARGEPAGPLDGVPVTIKEMIATAGLPVPMGTAASELMAATRDAPPAARMREAGAIMLAKTTAPDYGMLSSGLSSFHSLARNPWDPRTNPGGSSAGAATAAAAGYGPLHVGTDIGGSVRLPAAWCALVGFKPSLGRVPVDPYYVGRCAGPMTRTVADAALMMRFLSLPDSRDAMSLPVQPVDWGDLDGDVRGRRIGLMLEAGCGMSLDPEIAAAVEEAARRFEAAGAQLVPLAPVLTRAMLDGLDQFWRARAWSDIRDLPSERRQKILPYIRRWAESGAEIDGATAVAGFGQTMAMRRACAAAFDEVDVVLSPTTPNLSFPAEWASPLNDPMRPFEHIVYTVPWNMGEQPAVSINAGFSRRGEPIGLQIVTPRFADLEALRLARLYEAWRGPITNWPTSGAA